MTLATTDEYPPPPDDGDDADLSVAEQAVLGACITNPGAIRVATETLVPDDFADTRLGQLYALLLEMHAAGHETDPISVGQESSRRRKSQRGGPLWLDQGEVLQLTAWGYTAGSIGARADVVATASHARQVTAQLTRSLLSARTAGDPAQTLADAIAGLAALRDGIKTAGLTARLLDDVLADTDPPHDWVIPHLLERGDRLMLTGEEGRGKSVLLRQITICAAAGVHPLTGQGIPPAEVLVVDVENTERQWRRQSANIASRANYLGTRRAGQHLHLACTGRMDITTDRDLSAIHALIDDHNPDLVLIGTLYKLTPRGITSDDEAAPVIAALDSIRDRGPALLVEAHAGHTKDSAGARAMRPRGSSALMAWPEFGFGLAGQHDDDRYVDLIRWRGDRDDDRDWPTSLVRGQGGELPWAITGPLKSQRGWT